MEKVDVHDKLSLFDAHWRPKIVGELNGQHVKLVKFAGPFVWHRHEHEDEMFFVLRGQFTMELRDLSPHAEWSARAIELSEGQFFIVPRGVEHRPVAAEEVSVMLFEPAGTLNTGDVVDAKTTEVLERI